MCRRTGLSLICLIAVTTFGEPVNLTGTVTDKNSAPVSNAIVTLLRKGLTATTDAKGEFAIMDGVSITDPVATVPYGEGISLANNTLLIRLEKPAALRIELFDLKGKLLKESLDERASPGVHRFEIFPAPPAATMTILRVSFGTRVKTFQCVSLHDVNRTVFSSVAAASPTGTGLASIQPGVDSLKAAAAGFSTRVVPITSYQQKVNITLDSSTLKKFSFFVTSLKALQELSGKTNGFGGDLRFGKTGTGAGLKGADSICECIAERSMPGSKVKIWRAFLSAAKDENGKQVNAIDRIGQGPWYDRIGRMVSPDIKGLLASRPDADEEIKNDLPNEDGTPNHQPDPTKPTVDNHHMITGTDTLGKLWVLRTGVSTTCNDWTSKAADAGKPYGGLSWPRAGMGGSGSGLGSSHWMAGLALCGCRDSIAIVESGGPPRNCDFIGGGGGYGGFYCFALTP